ncbi:MAG: hypothetical protein ACI3W7_09050 [Oscillospiraceae bacterium]
MNGSAKRTARLALFVALGVIFLLLARIIPSGRIGLMVLTSFPVCLALMHYGVGWAFGVFAVTAVLGLLLFPGAVTILYLLFFGYYPIAKSFFERPHSRALCYVLKLALYAAVFAGAYLLAEPIGLNVSGLLPWYLLLPLGAVVFLIYDWCYSQIIRIYLDKFARYYHD